MANTTPRKAGKPQPTVLKLLRGNPGRRPISQNEPTPEPLAVLPSPPDFLGKHAKVEWRRVVSVMADCGLLTDLDLTAFSAYCNAFGNWRTAVDALARVAKQDKMFDGLIIKTKSGNLINNPLVGIVNKSRADMMKIATEFGFTPSSRTGIDVGQLPKSKSGKRGGENVWATTAPPRKA